MRWQGRRQSSNVEDRRGVSGRGLAVGGGIGGLGIVIAILYMLLGGNPGDVTQGLQVDQPYATGSEEPLSAKDKEMGEMRLHRPGQHRRRLEGSVPADGTDLRGAEARSVLGPDRLGLRLRRRVLGPVLLSRDSKVYIDLSFFEQMQRQLGAPGDFALAYVIAHEVGHHVQNLLGINDQVMAQRGRMTEKEFNKVSVRMELQADFLAGVWAHYANQEKGFLEPGTSRKE